MAQPTLRPRQVFFDLQPVPSVDLLRKQGFILAPERLRSDSPREDGWPQALAFFCELVKRSDGFSDISSTLCGFSFVISVS